VNPFSLLAFFAFVVYVYFGVYVWRREPSARLNRSFVLLCACFAYWAGFFTFIYPAATKDLAWTLYRIAAPGWCLLPGVALYFVLVASRSPIVRSPWSVLAFVAPGAVFAWRAATGTLIIDDLRWSRLGWHEVSAPHSPWFALYVVYAIGGILGGAVQIVRWRRRSSSRRERRQASTILVGWVVGAVLMFVPNIAMPAVGLHIVPAIGPIVSLVFPYAIWRAIERYRLMTLTASFAADAIVEKIADMTLLVSPEGRTLVVNPAACRMLGYRREELDQRDAAVLFEDTAQARSWLGALMEAPGASWRREVAWRTKSGEAIPADTSAAGIAGGDDVIGAVIVGHDLRPTKQLQQQLAERERVAEEWRRAKEAADEASAAKSSFLANMSHELRTPLNAIIGYGEILQEESRDAGAVDLLPDLRRIDDAARHLLTMVSDILELANIESGRVELRRRPFDLAATVAEAVATVRPFADKNDNVLQVHVDDRLPLVVSDEVKVRQILVSLLGNACKFTKNGRVMLEVSSRDGSEVLVRVQDTGIGMTPEQLARVFEPFTQGDGKATRKFGGTGLGLTLISRLCQVIGATIQVTSVPGEGSTFAVRIPTQRTDRLSKPDSPGAPCAP
jgi:PAS domain S-box-containing protein